MATTPHDSGPNRRSFAGLAFLLAAAVTVLWIRLLPLSLGGVEDPDRFRYRAEDGREHVYLGDVDSYLWIRHARNILRSGSSCDRIVDGVCRDTYANAPVGRQMLYARSLHITAIVALQRLLTLFRPGHPLEMTAFWVPVIVGVLGVVPAFAIGCRLAGDVGGFTAAVTIGANPYFLARSIGGDNDVWNVVLPLWAAWAAIVAAGATNPLRQCAGALLAAAFVALEAATWSGWPFIWVVCSSALLANLVAHVLRRAVARRGLPPSAGNWQAAALAFLVFSAASGLLVALAGGSVGDLRLPPWIVARMLGTPPAAANATAGPAEPYWPDVFATVVETAPPGLGGAAAVATGHWGRPPSSAPEGAPAGERAWGLYLVLSGVGVVLLWWPRRDRPWNQGAALLVTAWLLGALDVVGGAVRLVLLLVPPVGIALGIALGRLEDGAARVATRWGSRAARLGQAAAAGLACLAVLPIVVAGVRIARAYTPSMDDAWWETLTHIRDATPADAIIDTAWDFGHWTKYVAERRVIADGASLGTHIPYWFARALLAPDEREAVGLLRMLNCGSDATPAPEGRLGAYGKLRAQGLDGLAAQSTIVELASLDRTAARAHLLAHGLGGPAADDVLRSTHCSPPPAYLVLSTELAGSATWALGGWDFRRAYVATVSRHRPEAEAVSDLVRRFAVSEDDARALYRQAAGVGGAGAFERFIVPRPPRLLTDWRPCEQDGVRGRCFIGNPSLTVMAYESHASETPRGGGADPNLAVLADVPGGRVLFGTPDLIRSTFTQLVYLDGRYARWFERFDERVSRGRRVTTWRIRDEPLAERGE